MPIYAFVLAGISSWFTPLPEYGSKNVCAMNALPSSTQIEIVNDENGRSSSCVVIGTGPFYGGRILDVSPSVASELGFYSAGIAHVRVYRISGYLPHCKLVPQPQSCKTPPYACILDLPRPAILRCP